MPIRPASPSVPGAAPSKVTSAQDKPAAASTAPTQPVAIPGHDGTSIFQTGGATPATPVNAPVPVTSSSAPSAKSLSQVFDALPTQGGGPANAKLLSKGLDAWNARWDMLTSANKSIDAQYFILEKDPFGYAFLGALLHKQLEGVPVRLMTDSMADTFGTHGFTKPLKGKDYLQEIVNNGGKAYVYHPLWQRPLDALKGDYSVLASNHDKILVVDGQKGVTGGRNIGQDYFADPTDMQGAWRDMDVSLEGAGPAKGLTAAMEAELANSNVARPVHKDLLGNWDKKDIQLLGAYAMMDYWLKAPPFTEEQKAQFRTSPEARAGLVNELVNEAVKQMPSLLPQKLRRSPSDDDKKFLTGVATELAAQLEARGSNGAFHQNSLPTHATDVKIIDQTSSATTRVNGMAPAMKDLVDAAKTRIDIENPYVVLTEDMMKSLEAASARGVEINIITNSPLSTDSDVTQAFFLEDWQTILARCPTAHIFVATGHQKFHTKSAVVDGEDALVSTYNLDLLSGYVNGEVGAVVKSKELAQDLSAAFTADRAKQSNGFLEYTIQKDENGKAVLKDGKPIPVFGPENHLPKDVLETYAKKRNLWGSIVRNHIPQFEPLRHPAIDGETK
ncbi:MAG: phospholipase D-like domain-containing protein [Myxococcaceae bacterium]